MKLKLVTKRLEIRPYAHSDFKAWVEFWTSMSRQKNEWDIARKGVQNDLSIKQFKQVLKHQNERRTNDSFYDFGVFIRSSGTLVGNVSLMDVSRGVFHNAYMGYSLSNLYWGRGFGKEAVRACIELGFTKIGLHRIEAGISPNNRRSIGLARTLGMRREGRKVQALFLEGRWQDIMVYALTCEDWGLKFNGSKPKPFGNRR